MTGKPSSFTPQRSPFYRDFVVEVKEPIRSAQYDASKAVNKGCCLSIVYAAVGYLGALNGGNGIISAIQGITFQVVWDTCLCTATFQALAYGSTGPAYPRLHGLRHFRPCLDAWPRRVCFPSDTDYWVLQGWVRTPRYVFAGLS